MIPGECEGLLENSEKRSDTAVLGSILDHLQYDPEHSYRGFTWATADKIRHPLLVLPNEGNISDSSMRRDQLDEQIASINNQLSALKSHRNSLAGISSIPDEVLGDIFLEPRPRYPYPLQRQMGQAHASFIEFGSYLPMQSISPFALLHRPGAHLLNISIYDNNFDVTLRNLHLLAPSMGRIHSLHVSSTKNALADLIEVLAREKRDNIRELSLWLCAEEDGEVLITPSTWTENIACNTRVLNLRNIVLDWCRLRDLSALTIRFDTVWTPPLGLCLVLDMVRLSPRLKMLCLDHCMTTPTGHENDLATVELPYLDTLDLRGRVAICAALISRLHFPRDCYIILHTWGINNTPRVQPLLDCLRPRYLCSDTLPFRLLQLDFYTPGVTFAWYNNTTLRTSKQLYNSAENSLRFTIHPRDESSLRRIARAILRTVPAAAKVEVLDVRNSWQDLSILTCAHLLDALRDLSTIVFSTFPSTLSILNALRVHFIRHLEDGVGPPPLQRIHWDRGHTRVDGDTSLELKNGIEGLLHELLWQYTDAGVYLQELVVEDATEQLPWETLRALARHVEGGVVVVNGARTRLWNDDITTVQA
ncbi:hypothetical protein K525DRAFT_286207 [Schizophyllum commune Loenen D]|nr:hypothetical protein K525DRAFT_286207 [Schizophyllum commune Loenen D]